MTGASRRSKCAALRGRAGAGFTLVELLVALLVFGLLAGITYQGLDSLSAASAAQREHADAFRTLERAVFTLDADLRQMASRLGRDRQNRWLPALLGATDSLLARRAGVFNPAGSSTGSLQQFRWRSTSAGLLRESWAQPSADPADAPLAATRYPDIGDLEFRFRDQNGGWQAAWPPAGAPAMLPTAVEYELSHPRFGRIRRLIVL